MTTTTAPSTRHHRTTAAVLLTGALATGLVTGCGRAPMAGPGTSPPATSSPSATATSPTATTSPTTSDDRARKADAQRLLQMGPTANQPGEPVATASRDGVVVASWSPGPDTRTLRLHFSGAPATSGPCGADYRALQWSSDTTVVVAVVEVARAAPPSDVACPAIAALRTVDVTLAAPPAGRMVLSLAGGSEVPRTTGQADGIPAR